MTSRNGLTSDAGGREASNGCASGQPERQWLTAAGMPSMKLAELFRVEAPILRESLARLRVVAPDALHSSRSRP